MIVLIFDFCAIIMDKWKVKDGVVYEIIKGSCIKL